MTERTAPHITPALLGWAGVTYLPGDEMAGETYERKTCPKCRGCGYVSGKRCKRCGGSGTILVISNPNN
jgi:DnaJ-class molecular chaperone